MLIAPQDQRRRPDWMVADVDDTILEELATPDRKALSPKALEVNHNQISRKRASQRLRELSDRGIVEREADGYYRITKSGIRYLIGDRIINEVEIGNAYSGVYDPKSDEYKIFKNGDEWSPSKISAERLAWGDGSSESGQALVVQAILRDVTDEDEFDLSFLITTARRFQLHTQNEWMIDQALLIGHLQRSGPDAR